MVSVCPRDRERRSGSPGGAPSPFDGIDRIDARAVEPESPSCRKLLVNPSGQFDIGRIDALDEEKQRDTDGDAAPDGDRSEQRRLEDRRVP